MKLTFPNFILCSISLLFLIGCTSPKQVACPDFSKNRNYAYKPAKLPNFNPKKSKSAKSYNFKTRKSDFDLTKEVLAEKSELVKISPVGITQDFFPEPETKEPVFIASTATNKAYSKPVYTLNKGPKPVYSKKLERATNRMEKASTKMAKKQPSGGKAQGFAVTSMIMGILGLFVFGLPLGILSIVFGSIALKRYQANPGQPGKGMAIAGIILGAISIIGALIFIALLV